MGYNRHKRCLIAGNWKMNGLLEDAEQFIGEMVANPAPESVEVAIMAPFTLLHPMKGPLDKQGIRLGAQNVYFEAKGAFTGSISAMMLRDIGCHYAIIGHSERRHIMGESDEQIKAKLHAAWAAGLDPILCIGEQLSEREDGSTNAVLETQLQVLKGAMADAPLTVAYEPVWAIGTGLTPTLEQVTETHAFIHDVLKGLGKPSRVLYGGSANAGNAHELLSCEGVNGLLVGGASLSAASFSKIIEAAGKVAREVKA